MHYTQAVSDQIILLVNNQQLVLAADRCLSHLCVKIVLNAIQINNCKG